MIRNRTGNNKFLKEFNQTRILDLIRVHESISRVELSQITGLSPTAVGVITSNLLKKGYIHETGTGESKGGRKPVLLELKPDSYYSVGIDVDVDYINIVLIDITARAVFESSMPMTEYAVFEHVIARIAAVIRETLERFSVAPGNLLGIGISVPGMVDNETRKITLAPNLGWRDVDIKSYLSCFSDIPVFVENEAMSSAICENWIGCCRDINNFVCINIKSGIGSGVFIDGKLYRGAGGSAGEIGHVVVDENI